MYFVSLSTLLPVPGLYAIKVFSVGADYLAGWFVLRLMARQYSAGVRPWAALSAFLFLPTVVINGALWGQCDIMYVCGFLASLFYLYGKATHCGSLIAFGLFPLLSQAPGKSSSGVPLLAGLASIITRRLPWRMIWVPLAVYLVCSIPAILAGRPILEAIGHWAMVDNLPGLTLGAANWYQWVFEREPDVFWWPGIVLTLVGTAFLLLWALEPRHPGLTEAQWLISLALLSVLYPPFFLPGMHERYFFCG